MKKCWFTVTFVDCVKSIQSVEISTLLILLTKNKYEVPKKFCEFESIVTNETCQRIVKLRTDNSTMEYIYVHGISRISEVKRNAA